MNNAGSTSATVQKGDGMKMMLTRVFATVLVVGAVLMAFVVTPQAQSPSDSSNAVSATVVDAQVQKIGFWSNTRDYFVCIVGLGVPIGTAMVLAGMPATYPVIYSFLSRDVAIGGRTVARTTERILGACGRFIRS